MPTYIELGQVPPARRGRSVRRGQDGFNGDYGGINNFYFYRFNNRKLFMFIPWDKSEAFKGGPNTAIFHNISDGPPTGKNRLLRPRDDVARSADEVSRLR